MTRRFSSACIRFIAKFCPAAVLICLILLGGPKTPVFAAGPVQQDTKGPKIWLQDGQRLPVTHVGATGGAANRTSMAMQNADAQVNNDRAVQALAGGQAQSLAMAKGDVDQDGFEDLVVGYAAPGGGIIAFHRGNIDAFAPQSDASFQAIGRGEFPSPFLPEARVFSVPVRPDFIALGNFTGQGNQDLVVAAKGGNALYLFAGDGKGNFDAPQAINLSGAITTLAGGDLGTSAQYTKLIVGISSNKGFSLSVYSGAAQGLRALASFSLPAAASNVNFGDFQSGISDAAFISGGQVFILRSSTMQLVKVNLPVSASALALGLFVYDRNGSAQIAVLSPDGGIQIAVRSDFNPSPYTVDEIKIRRQARALGQPDPLAPVPSFPANGWKIVDTFPSVASVAPGQTPVFFRTRISSNGADDIMWLSAATGQMVVISHPDAQPGASTFLPGQVSVKPYSGSPINALPMRLNVDGRPGIMALHRGDVVPTMVMPIPDPTFTVNTTSDVLTPGACAAALAGCSLREAIIEANATGGTDTIMVPAGTYTLTRPRAATPLYDAITGTLNINDSVNIIGAGQSTVIIQGGTTDFSPGPANGVDMVMSVNEDIPSATVPTTTTATANISNLTIQNGNNLGAHGNDGDGGCMEFDTGTAGTANLFLTNVTVAGCTTNLGNGGGLANFNFVVNGPGLATISNSIFQGNRGLDPTGGGGASGGGIWVSNPSRILMTNSQVLNNIVTEVNGVGGRGIGGGIRMNANGTTRQTVIHASTISGNQASGPGGGIWSDSNLIIDQGTIISGNAAGANGGGAQDGGGIFYNPQPAQSGTLTKVTITGNTATGTGGGIAAGALSISGPLTMSFSRLATNTAPTGSNLNNLGSVVTVTSNWWATNTPATTINTVVIGGSSTTFTPWINLTHQGSPNLLRVGDTSTLTADFRHLNTDPLGSPSISATNLDVFTGLPITFNNNVHGTITGAQPFIENRVAISTVSETGCVIPPVAAPPCTATVTVTTSTPHGFSAGQTVTIAGVTDPTYDGVFTVSNPVTASTFTYTTQSTGSTASSGGTAGVPTGQATATYTATSGGVDLVHATVDGFAATAQVVVLFPPSIAKVFGATHIPVGGTTSLTFTITNINTLNSLNGLAFTDNLPAGLVVATPNGVTNTCAGTVTAVAGSGSISLSGGTVAANTACAVAVNVTGVTDGVQNNTSGNITATDAGGLTGNTASASITVINPPTIAKAFGAATIPLNGTTSLTFTLSSTNANLTLNGVAFADTLPAGLVVATPSGLTSTCSGTATAVAGSGSVSLTGATLAPAASCTISVNVTGTTAGVKNNSVTVTSTDVGGLTGNTSNASITVVAPPTISKAFGAASIPLNGTTTMTFTITNPNTTVALTGIAFSDTVPANLQMIGFGSGGDTCGGVTSPGASTVNYSALSVAASSSCFYTVTVKGIAAGDALNTTSTITSTEGGTGTTSNTATLTVVAPPSIAKAFGAATIPLNGTTSLTFTITNPAANTVAETGVALTDTLPAGLVVATPNGLTNTCGGTATAVAGSGSVSLTGGTIAVNTSCTLTANVTGTTAGLKNNTTGNVTSTNGGTGNTASANITVVAPPTITKAFGAATIPLNGSTSLTFTITNPNASVALTGVAFTDTLPAGLVVATPNGLSSTCGGTATAVAGSGSVSLSGGTLAVSASCTLSVNVTGTTAGVKNNSVQVTSTEGGTGNTSNASVTVVAPPVIIKAFGAASIPLNGSTSLTFTIQNNNTGTTLTGVGFSDTLPAGLVVSTPNGLTGSCGGGTITATQATSVISLSGASLAASTSCTFAVNVTGTTAGTQNNTTGNVTSTEGGTGGTASASINVVAPPSIAKAERRQPASTW